MKKRRKLKKSFVIILFALILGSTIFSGATYCFNKQNTDMKLTVEKYETLSYNARKGEDTVYLSDIDYMSNQSYTEWDKIRYDEVNGGGKITLKIENNAFTFEKGIWAHANSQVTYDISNYNYRY